MGDITGNGTAVTGLGGAAGFGETMLPRGDDTVAQVDMSAVFDHGFTLAGVHYGADQVTIATDGRISLGTTDAAPFFAIFNADVDTRLDGEGAESGAIWLDVDTAQDCVTITWDHVGFYRRNATLTNTFQMQLFDRGHGGFDVVYRYQDITWTSGDLQGGWGGLDGTAALIGHRAGPSGAASLLPPSGDQAAQLALAGALGNTGVAGLWVLGFAGASVILGTAGADCRQGTSGDDTLRGLAGADVLTGSDGADVMDGGGGLDRADYGTSAMAVRIDLATPAANTGQAVGDRFVGVEGFAGTALADTLLGDAGANRFDGGAGADSLDGRGGADILSGAAGADRLLGGAGDDRLDAGADDDVLQGDAGADVMIGGTGDDDLSGGDGDDSLTGGDGHDQLTGGQGRDQMRGGLGHDSLHGGDSADVLAGDDGDDLLTGDGGDDLIFGGVGLDRLNGGAGDDTLDGGLSQDRLTGGSGADGFAHAGTGGQGSDWITDFNHASGDHLIFGIAGARRSDFAVTYDTLAGAGRPGMAEALVTYLPLSRLVWVLVDGADQTAILLQSSMNSFDLL